MNRPRMLMLIAIPILVGIYLYDRANSTETTLPATVLSVEETSNGDGPDTWQIMVETSDGSYPLDLQTARPDLKPGDTLCVTRVTRQGQDHSHRLTTGETTC